MPQDNHIKPLITGCEKLVTPKERCKRGGVKRRVVPAEGYCYLHTVGWVCRRKLERRRTDNEDK